jgi:hypothetical protein
MSATYDSDSDISSSSSSSSGSNSSSVFEGDISSLAASSSHLLSPPPLSTPTATGERDTPLRQPRSRSSSFASPILRPSSNTRSRAGSLSLLDSHSDASLHINANQNVITPTPSYLDLANRPRSTPRNRTPRRNSTPVLGPVNRSSIANEERNSSNERSSRSTTPNTSAAYIRPQRIVGLGANLAVGTVLRTGSLSALHERPGRTASSMAQQPRSAKQGPGHRKVRRWNNDKFIGIASDISNSLSSKNPQKGMRIANIYAEAEMEKSKYTMPNAPRGNRTIFGTLVSANRKFGGDDFSDESDDGGYASDCIKVKLDPARVAQIRERFVDGEVGEDNTFVMSNSAKERMRKREEELYKDGHRMTKKVNQRLLKVVIRACKGSGFTRNVVDAFEKLLLSLPNNGSSASTSTSSKPETDIWNKVLVQKPLITRKSNPGTSGSSVTIRMLFSENESKGAFNRLLLHAVCQFHDLDTSSSTTSKGHRMMTVTGICKGGDFRFLEYVPFDGIVSSDTGTKESVSIDDILSSGTDKQHSSSLLTTTMALDKMSALKVS